MIAIHRFFGKAVQLLKSRRRIVIDSRALRNGRSYCWISHHHQLRRIKPDASEHSAQAAPGVQAVCIVVRSLLCVCWMLPLPLLAQVTSGLDKATSNKLAEGAKLQLGLQMIW